jgi:hypothetical protein
MFNIFSYKGNANTPRQNGNHQENKQQMLVRMWGNKSFLYTIGRNAKYAALMKSV